MANSTYKSYLSENLSNKHFNNNNYVFFNYLLCVLGSSWLLQWACWGQKRIFCNFPSPSTMWVPLIILLSLVLMAASFIGSALSLIPYLIAMLPLNVLKLLFTPATVSPTFFSCETSLKRSNHKVWMSEFWNWILCFHHNPSCWFMFSSLCFPGSLQSLYCHPVQTVMCWHSEQLYYLANPNHNAKLLSSSIKCTRQWFFISVLWEVEKPSPILMLLVFSSQYILSI